MTLADALRANADALAAYLRGDSLRKRDLAGLVEDMRQQAAEAEVLRIMAGGRP